MSDDDLATRLRADELTGERQSEREARIVLAGLLGEAATEIERLRGRVIARTAEREAGADLLAAAMAALEQAEHWIEAEQAQGGTQADEILRVIRAALNKPPT